MADKENVIGLIRKFQAGERDVFDEFYKETYRLVYSTCYGHLNSAEDAEDVTQEVYLAVYQSLDKLESPEAYSAWMVRIASLKSIDFYRKRRNVVFSDSDAELDALAEDWEEVDMLPDSFIEEKEKADIINKVLRESLSAVQYQTLFMHYYDDMKIPEIARAMDCSEGTVKTRLMSARNKFKSALSSYVDENKLVLAAAPFFTRLFTAQMAKISIPQPMLAVPALKAGIDLTAGAAQGAANAVTNAAAEGASAGTATNASSAALKTAKSAGRMKPAKSGFLSTTSGKVITGALALTLTGSAIVGGILIFGGKKAKHKVIPVNDYLTYSVDGYSPRGNLEYSLDYDRLQHDYPELGNVSRADLEKMVGGKWNKKDLLANGDKIVFTWYKGEDIKAVEEENNVEFELKDIVYEVDGLKDKEVIDPFDYVEVVFEGQSPEIKAELKLLEMPYHPGGSVTYKLDKCSLLSEGDAVTVTVTNDEPSFILSRDSKEYVVVGSGPAAEEKAAEVRLAETVKAGGCEYKIPEVLIDGVDMSGFNSEIRKDISGCAASYNEEAQYPGGTDYRYYIGGRIVSLVVVYLDDVDGDSYAVYNISLEDGHILTKDEFIEVNGMSKDGFDKAVYDSVKQYMDSEGKQYYQTDMAGFKPYEYNLRDEAVKAAIPYYDANGDISFIGEITGAGGADYYEREIKLVR